MLLYKPFHDWLVSQSWSVEEAEKCSRDVVSLHQDQLPPLYRGPVDLGVAVHKSVGGMSEILLQFPDPEGDDQRWSDALGDLAKEVGFLVSALGRPYRPRGIFLIEWFRDPLEPFTSTIGALTGTEFQYLGKLQGFNKI